MAGEPAATAASASGSSAPAGSPAVDTAPSGPADDQPDVERRVLNVVGDDDGGREQIGRRALLVLGTRVEPLHPLHGVVQRREHQDRHGDAAAPPPTQEVEAVKGGQSPVEDDDMRRASKACRAPAIASFALDVLDRLAPSELDALTALARPCP